MGPRAPASLPRCVPSLAFQGATILPLPGLQPFSACLIPTALHSHWLAILDPSFLPHLTLSPLLKPPRDQICISWLTSMMMACPCRFMEVMVACSLTALTSLGGRAISLAKDWVRNGPVAQSWPMRHEGRSTGGFWGILTCSLKRCSESSLFSSNGLVSA